MLQCHCGINTLNMQFLVLSVLLTACMVAAGPLNLKEKANAVTSTLNIEGESSKREKRSHVGAGSYAQANSYAGNSYNAGSSFQAGNPGYLAAPCASAPIAIAPAASGGYPVALPAHVGYGGGGYPSHISPYGGGGYPQYRAEDLYENEMSYSDMPGMEHNPMMARSYGYDVLPAASQIASSSAYGAGAYGPAVGVFPNANVGGCALPLLLSCSPNVQAGKIVRQSHYGAPAGYGSIAVSAYPAGGVAVSSGGVSVSAGGAGGYRDNDEHEVMQPSHHEDQHLDESIPAVREKFSGSNEKSHHNDK